RAGLKRAQHSVPDRPRTPGRKRHGGRRGQRIGTAGVVTTMTNGGRLIGVGGGPGDPEVMTLKAVRALNDADLVAHFARNGSAGNARTIAAAHLRAGTEELALRYPVTTEIAKDCDAYRDAMTAFYDGAAKAIAGHLDAGRTVAVICEGDPLFYGSF